MANMSYCRFRNTLSDLGDCEDALENGEAYDEDMDPAEVSARKSLIARCRDIADRYATSEG